MSRSRVEPLLLPEQQTSTTETINDPHARRSVRPIATLWGTAVVTLQNIVGVGTLSFAAAFSDASLVPGVVVVCASCALGILSSHTIVACLEASRQQTFLGVVEHLFNRKAAVAVELAVGLTTMCSTLAYMIDIVDALKDFIGAFTSDAALTSRWFAAICVCVPCVVLTSFRDLNRLKPYSALGVLGLVFASVVVCVLCLTTSLELPDADKPELFAFHSDFFNSLSIGILSFAMQYNVPRLFYELGFRPRDTHAPPGGFPDVREVKKTLFQAIVLANLIALTWYIVVGIIPYRHFGRSVPGDIINGFHDVSPADRNLMTAARGVIVLSLIAAVPITGTVARDAVFNVCRPADCADEDWPGAKVRVLSSVTIIGVVGFVAVVFSDIETALSFKGSTFIAFIMLWLPAVASYGLCPSRRLVSLVLLLAGFVCTGCGLFSAIHHAMHND